MPYFTLQFNLADNDLLSKYKYPEHRLVSHIKCSTTSAVPLKSHSSLIKAAGAKQFASVLLEQKIKVMWNFILVQLFDKCNIVSRGLDWWFLSEVHILMNGLTLTLTLLLLKRKDN